MDTKKITLTIPTKRYKFFVELLKNLDFVQVDEVEADSDTAIRKNLTQAFQDLQKFKEGKLKTQSAKILLDEL
jgi:hypothetical protein